MDANGGRTVTGASERTLSLPSTLILAFFGARTAVGRPASADQTCQKNGDPALDKKANRIAGSAGGGGQA
jgi:hypothetical protein